MTLLDGLYILSIRENNIPRITGTRKYVSEESKSMEVLEKYLI